MIGSHIVPRFYLEQFAVKTRKSAKTGHLWVYSKDRTPRRGTPKTEGVENGYFAYPLPNGAVDESIESNLAALETRANDVLVMAPHVCFAWTLQYRKIMAEYVGLLFARSRGRLEGSAWIQGRVSQLMLQLKESGFFDEIAAEYSRKYSVPADKFREIVEKLADSNTSKDSVRKAFLDDLISNAKLATGQILDRPWQVWRSGDSSEFVTSDTPVVTAVPINEELAPGFGFRVPGVLVLFPLSPRACLVIGNRGRENPVVGADRIYKINDLIVRFMRLNVYSRSESPRIQKAVVEFGGQVEFGVNAFIPKGDHLTVFKRIIRESLGLEPTSVSHADFRSSTA